MKQLQSFLGLRNYYRKFQQNYAELTSKFTHLLGNNNKSWIWGEKETITFEKIKKAFLETIILQQPNFEKPFYLNTDASDIALGAVLYEVDENEDHLVIAFASRNLQNSEINYTVTEKELLKATAFACKKFRNNVLGNKTTIRSDHKALTFLKTVN